MDTGPDMYDVPVACFYCIVVAGSGQWTWLYHNSVLCVVYFSDKLLIDSKSGVQSTIQLMKDSTSVLIH